MAERRDRAPRLDQPREKRRQFITRPEALTSEAFGVLSEKFARYMGTAYFLIGMTVFVLVWVVWNLAAPLEWRFDNYPFIFLTLMLSLQASYAAPLILLAQNRQADRDRVMLEQDRTRDERNLADTEFLTREVAALRIAMRDSATRDFVRGELRDLLDEMEERGLVIGRLAKVEKTDKADHAGKRDASDTSKRRTDEGRSRRST
ncbi:hypothetical protein JNB_07649 [Janibacter sp. HTCC2649]|uniref:DUF1003 domain-containing protein n=1 Tax=Janibacter sp. HTCC2649 TaxID=313589 RepID=UPI0000670AD3|nr:DUF1003 domain-containing protein [Janibacter sp. HTCC2649]EAQ00027.1 hypothetical protein JNB_07649 [Janibacter sp. HTCC2649]